MSFSYETENLGLPIWGSGDKPTQDDLNFLSQHLDKEIIEKIKDGSYKFIYSEESFNYRSDVNGGCYFRRIEDFYINNKYVNLKGKQIVSYNVNTPQDFNALITSNIRNQSEKFYIDVVCFPYDFADIKLTTRDLQYIIVYKESD